MRGTDAAGARLVDEALTIQLSLAEQHAAAGRADPYVDEEIAACRAALESSDAALESSDAALESSDQDHA